jgi:hypothetical protein
MFGSEWVVIDISSIYNLKIRFIHIDLHIILFALLSDMHARLLGNESDISSSSSTN